VYYVGLDNTRHRGGGIDAATELGGSWGFWQMTFGSAAPISVDTMYDS
jgi:hypothetical protein